MMCEILSIQNLHKNYGALKALNGISFKVYAGNVFGILGPNGSGKTTILGILLGVINSNQGDFSWFGQQPTKKLRRQIGSLLETPNFYPHMSGRNNLKINANIKGVPFSDIDRVLKLVKLYERANSKFKTYSLGMKQRLAIAATLLGDPEVLVLDEPTNGLDPQGIAEVRSLIIELGEQGRTIILASHLLDEVQKVCKQAVIIKNGNLLVGGDVDEILGNEVIVEMTCDNSDAIIPILEGYAGIISSKRQAKSITLVVESNFDTAQLNRFLFEKGIVLSSLHIQKKSLEAQFLELTQ